MLELVRISRLNVCHRRGDLERQTRGNHAMAESAEPKIDAWAAYEKHRLGGPNLTRIDSRLASDGNPPKRPYLQSPRLQQRHLT
jgi:hypothetical protein